MRILFFARYFGASGEFGGYHLVDEMHDYREGMKKNKRAMRSAHQQQQQLQQQHDDLKYCLPIRNQAHFAN